MCLCAYVYMWVLCMYVTSLPLNTHIYMYMSGGKICQVFKKFSYVLNPCCVLQGNFFQYLFCKIAISKISMIVIIVK